jgi:uncharacterized membrane protein YfhO
LIEIRDKLLAVISVIEAVNQPVNFGLVYPVFIVGWCERASRSPKNWTITLVLFGTSYTTITHNWQSFEPFYYFRITTKKISKVRNNNQWMPPLGYQSEAPFFVAAFQSLSGVDRKFHLPSAIALQNFSDFASMGEAKTFLKYNFHEMASR